MTINKIFDGSTLTVQCEGELDSLSSGNLEAVVRTDLDEVENLIFDFEKLNYVSSAGLRVIMEACKIMNMQGEMRLINVNSAIKEVLTMTGMSNILNIE